MNKNFFKRPFYYTAGKISRIMKNFQKKQDEKIIENNNNSWNVLFGNNNFFQFNLANDVKINLYKDSILSRLIYDGFEKDEINYMSSVLEKGDIFIDVGANIGLFSLIASKKVGNDGLVISFEPSPTTYKRFIENIELNSYENIDARNIGLSDKKEELMFFVSNTGYDAWNSFAPRKDNILKEKISVPLSTLDIELKNVDKNKIKLIKIDVEGWEKFVLNGAEDFFVNYKPIVMIEFTEENTFNAGYPVYDIYDKMLSYGYVWYRIVEGQLINEEKKIHYPYDNLIAIKKDFNMNF